MPLKFVPVYEEYRCEVGKVKQFELESSGSRGQKSTETSIALAKKGMALFSPATRRIDIERAVALFEAARTAGLNDIDYAIALGSAGCLWMQNERDIPRAYQSCRLSVEIAPAGYWQSSFILSLVYEGIGRLDDAQKALKDAQRFARTRWWEGDMEQQLRTTAKNWFATHGTDELERG